MTFLPTVRPHTESAVLGGNQMQTWCGFTDMFESKMCHPANMSLNIKENKTTVLHNHSPSALINHSYSNATGLDPT